MYEEEIPPPPRSTPDVGLTFGATYLSHDHYILEKGKEQHRNTRTTTIRDEDKLESLKQCIDNE